MYYLVNTDRRHRNESAFVRGGADILLRFFDAVSFAFKLKAEGFISSLETKEKLKSISIFFSSVEK